MTAREYRLCVASPVGGSVQVTLRRVTPHLASIDISAFYRDLLTASVHQRPLMLAPTAVWYNAC
jgi:hypothetical protein